jgi:hypothetical protein
MSLARGWNGKAQKDALKRREFDPIAQSVNRRDLLNARKSSANLCPRMASIWYRGGTARVSGRSLSKSKPRKILILFGKMVEPRGVEPLTS